jgi:predicted dehydrogenase
MPRAQLGIGLVGTGRHGLRYARHLKEGVPGLRLAGFARQDPAQIHDLARELGCPGSADYRDLLARPDVDAVVVAVPPSLHLEIVGAALQAGKPVLLEKPAALNLAEGKRMLQSARHAGVPVMVAQTMRYNETVVAVRNATPRLGRIHSLRVSQRFEPSPTPWIQDPRRAGGGAMLHTGIHGFDLVRFLSGLEGERVSAEVQIAGGGEVDDNFSAVVRLVGGSAVATVSGCRATNSRTGAIEIAGERGQLVADHVLGHAWLVTGKTAEPLTVDAPVATLLETLLGFSRALREDAPMPIPLVEGLRAVALVDAGYASARSGCAVPVEAVLDGDD